MRTSVLAVVTFSMAISLATVTSGVARAQAPARAESDAESGKGEDWYYESGYEKPTPQMIIQQKAQVRAAARIRRIETMAAYGMSNSRPTANAAPMTGMYSPAWQMPGGRPFAWYTTQRPYYIFLR